jgi:RNA binding exosome subunit
MKSPIQSVEVTYLVHATEDAAKVSSAVAGLLGVPVDPEVESLEGHFGNKIEKARVHLTGEEAGRAFASIISRMPAALKREIVADIGGFLDEHSALFLRFDKQQLVSGELTLASGDPVRVKVKPRIFLVKGGAAGFYTQLIGGR